MYTNVVIVNWDFTNNIYSADVSSFHWYTPYSE